MTHLEVAEMQVQIFIGRSALVTTARGKPGDIGGRAAQLLKEKDKEDETKHKDFLR